MNYKQNLYICTKCKTARVRTFNGAVAHQRIAGHHIFHEFKPTDRNLSIG
jgi:hypothetical protein